MAPKQQPTIFLLVGNPGTGKSTILNGMIGEAVFKSGISYGKGMTFELQKYIKEPHTFMDTPGLSDTLLRKEAAAAITEALKYDGFYKIFFVLTLEAGRVKPDDVTTMKLVLEAAPITNFGIILNKLPKKQFQDLQDPAGLPMQAIMESMALGMHRDKLSGQVCPVRRDDDLEDAKDVPMKLPTYLEVFINELQGIHIAKDKVKDVEVHDFDKLKEEMEELLQDSAAAKRKLEQQGIELDKLRAQAAESTSTSWFRSMIGMLGDAAFVAASAAVNPFLGVAAAMSMKK